MLKISRIYRCPFNICFKYFDLEISGMFSSQILPYITYMSVLFFYTSFFISYEHLYLYLTAQLTKMPNFKVKTKKEKNNKISNSEEISKWTVTYEIDYSKAQTHQNELTLTVTFLTWYKHFITQKMVDYIWHYSPLPYDSCTKTTQSENM